MTVEEQNKEIVSRYLDSVWSQRDWSVAEDVLAEDVVFHDQVRDGDLPPGREGMRTSLERMRTGSSDFTFEVDDLIAEGDKVAVRWRAIGTNTGEFNGVPGTGRHFTIDGIAIVRLQDGRIVEGWQESDRLGLLQQLGLFPQGRPPRLVGSAMASFVRLRDRLAKRD